MRVRCLGYHTEDVIALPTVDLPWAHVMHPVTDPSMQGIGTTPSWLTPDPWVIGFWRDEEFQQPLIMGSYPNAPQEETNPVEGFNDPRGDGSIQQDYLMNPVYGPYPERIVIMMSVNQILVNLGRGEASEGHQSLIDRRRTKTAW